MTTIQNAQTLTKGAARKAIRSLPSEGDRVVTFDRDGVRWFCDTYIAAPLPQALIDDMPPGQYQVRVNRISADPDPHRTPEGMAATVANLIGDQYDPDESERLELVGTGWVRRPPHLPNLEVAFLDPVAVVDDRLSLLRSSMLPWFAGDDIDLCRRTTSKVTHGGKPTAVHHRPVIAVDPRDGRVIGIGAGVMVTGLDVLDRQTEAVSA